MVLIKHKKMLLAYLREVGAIRNGRLYGRASEGYTRELIELVDTFAVIEVVRTLMRQAKNEMDEIILEGYLFNWLRINAASLVIRGTQTVVEIKANEEGYANFMRQYAVVINGLISGFDARSNGIETPISSQDYIDWYASSHGQ